MFVSRPGGCRRPGSSAPVRRPVGLQAGGRPRSARAQRSEKVGAAAAKALVVPAPGRSGGLRGTGPAAAPGRGERRGGNRAGRRRGRGVRLRAAAARSARALRTSHLAPRTSVALGRLRSRAGGRRERGRRGASRWLCGARDVAADPVARRPGPGPGPRSGSGPVGARGPRGRRDQRRWEAGSRLARGLRRSGPMSVRSNCTGGHPFA
jgi:hypothetical protein